MRRLLTILSCIALAAAGCLALPGLSRAAAAAPASAAGTFHPVNSVRVLDTRPGSGLAGGQVARFAVTGRGGIASGAAAVTINLTVLRPATAGSIAVFPGGTAWNGSASVSFAAGQNKQNMVTATLGADGTLSVRNNIASTIQVIGDVAGYYSGGTPNTPGAFRAIAFQRAFDTRKTHPLAPGSVTRMSIAGHGAVPATGVAAVLGNLSVLTPGRTGSVSTWAGDSSWDGSASVSFAAGRTEQDVVNIALGVDGTAMIRNNTGVALQVVLDLIGYYLAGTPAGYGAYQPIAPSRVFDSRTAFSPLLSPGQAAPVLPVMDQRTRLTPVPDWGVPAIVVRFTVLTPASAGSLSIFPGDRGWNGSTSISFGAGASVQQQSSVVLGLDDAFQLQYNGAGSASVVADVLGYYLGVPNPLHYGSGNEIDPKHGTLADISCPTATFCMAVQAAGFAERWTGTGWTTPVRAGQARALRSVSCTSASFCAAAGLDAAGLTDVEIFDGTAWRHSLSLPRAGYMRVACASASFCLANAGASYAVFDGSTWSTSQASGTQLMSLNSISCLSAGFCLAADYSGRTSTFDGTGWSAPVRVGDVATAWSVACASASVCVAVHGVQASTFDGTAWSAPSTIDPNRALKSVSCISTTDCRASDSAGAVLRFDGTAWSAPVPVLAQVPAVLSCSVAGTCGLIDTSVRASGAMFDGTSWSAPQIVDFLPGDLTALSCTSASFCVAVDNAGYVLRYNGTAWTPPSQIAVRSALTGVSCTGPSFCVAVDAAGRAHRFDGSAWAAAVTVSPEQRLADVSCTSPSFCVAVGADQAAIFDGNTWSTPATIVPGPYLNGVSCRGSAFCVAVTSSGMATVFNGSTWSTAESTTAYGNVHAVSCPTTSYCLAPGYSRLSSWNGTAWSPYFVPAATIFGASCPQAEFCVATTESFYHFQGQASVWDGTEWSLPAAAPVGRSFSPGSAISCPSTTFCMQVDGRTYAYRLDG